MIAVGFLPKPAARRVFCCRAQGLLPGPRNGPLLAVREPVSSDSDAREKESQAAITMVKQEQSTVTPFGQRPRRRGPGVPMPRRRQDSSRLFSILFASPADRTGDDGIEAPKYFPDLNCDQIVDAITAGRDEYNLKPIFYARLPRVEAIKYRHEVMQDLQSAPLYECVSSFASKMREVREHLVRTQKMYYKEQKQAWFLDGVEIYCELIKSFSVALDESDLQSRGFIAFRDYLLAYSRSAHFNSILSEVKKLKADLATIEYCVLIKGSGFTVCKYDSEIDYSSQVGKTFEKFQQGAATDYRIKFSVDPDMNHIEAKIAEFVAKLYPEIFAPITEFCKRNNDFIERAVAAFDREVQFYLAYLEYIAPLRRSGLAFCYPAVSDTNQEIYSRDGFDIALAHKLLKGNSPVVCNDFELKGKERVLVVSGPNQGGKTTFARAFGQLHYLANIGCPVPGRDAQLFLFDRIFTHFEKEEKVENLRGKLEDDLLRIHGILGRTTRRSIIIMNEIFTSTTIQDETFLSERVMEQVVELGLLCVWVTFVDELASFGPPVVSMVSTVIPENPALRTFKIVRRPADGLAYAMAIAQKYGLTYDSIRKRVGP
jgi:DNA mismatch repair protein MutS